MRSYRTVSPLPAIPKDDVGGLFSVALSLGSLPVGVTHLRCPVEAGLSSRGSAKTREGPARAARGRLARCSTRLLQQPFGSLHEQTAEETLYHDLMKNACVIRMG